MIPMVMEKMPNSRWESEPVNPQGRDLTCLSPFALGPYRLKNRIVALPVYTGYAHPGGQVSSLLINHYERLAESGVAMVVVANAAVATDGVVSDNNLRIDDDAFISGLRRLARAIKKRGSLACLQLNHAGRFAKTQQPLLPSSVDKKNIAFNLASMKDFMNAFPLEKRFGLTRYVLGQLNTWRRAMTREDIERIITSFGDAAARAVESEFDMVELHGAGGYLVNQFLSPFTNKIHSAFGGDRPGRMAFPLAVIREIKTRTPLDYPVGFRLMVQEWVPEGIDLAEALAIVKLLERERVSYLSASVASYNSIFSKFAISQMARPGYLRKDMAAITGATTIPTIISGRVINPGLAHNLIQEGSADLIGLGRPLRVDPEWVVKTQVKGKRIVPCINCNWCLKRVVLGQGFACRRWPKMVLEKTDLELKLLSRVYKGLFVITDLGDLEIIRKTLPLLLPDSQKFPAAISPTILFLETSEHAKHFDSAQDDFLEWARRTLDSLGFKDGILRSHVQIANEAYDKEVHKTIEQGNHGVIILCRNPTQAWRERLLYIERGKVVALIGSSDYLREMLVPVDLSPTTHLVLMFLRQTYLGKAGYRLRFIHVSSSPPRRAERRWEEIKEVIGIQENIPLDVIHTKKKVSEDILDQIRAGNYGTIIMGKRGLSGIKRFLLGSVSTGVLRGLTDQSLFLID
jgi:2,4-dienoyl-CoA reductase (NADPH2)